MLQLTLNNKKIKEFFLKKKDTKSTFLNLKYLLYFMSKPEINKYIYYIKKS